MRVYFTHLGCKLNQAEIESLARDFLGAGHRLASSLESADLHVINSCTVTHLAARDSRKLARRGRRRNPALRTVLTGCYASERPEEAAALAGVDLVVPNAQKEALLERVHEAFPLSQETALPRADGSAGGSPHAHLELGHTRAAVKVEDGCNVGCAFCIIPLTRGRQRSRPLPEVVEEVAALAAVGVQEVVITGVQISHYRWQGRGLYELTQALLEETRVPRLRLTSIAPWRLDERLLELWSDRRLCRHVHLSLQSGCTATLARMGRPYTAEAYARVVERFRQAIPGLAVTTDIIAGFPGESSEEHEESLAFARRMAFARIHAFPYSRREGTEAAGLADPVPHEEKRARMKALLDLAAESEADFETQQVGGEAEVLWEERRGGLWRGITDNYLRVWSDSPQPLANRLTRAWLRARGEDGLYAEPALGGESGARRVAGRVALPVLP